MGSPRAKTRRRTPGEDSIYQRASDDRWMAEIRLGFKPNGRPHIKYLSEPGFPNDTRPNRKRNTEARNRLLQRMDEARHQLRQGLPAQDDALTVSRYLAQWLEARVKPSKRETTYEGYESAIRVHIIPALGRKYLTKLTPLDVQQMLTRVVEGGGSPTTAKNVRGVLRKALNDAIKDGLLIRNVVTLTEMPRQIVYQAKPLTMDEIPRFMTIIRGHRLAALWTTLVTLGLRAGEAYGLRWRDVDLDTGDLTIRVQMQRTGTPPVAKFVEPKTHRSRRALPIPDNVRNALLEHHRRQEREQIVAGDRWKGAEWDDLVFSTTIGTPLDPSNVLKQFRELLDVAGIDPKLRVHDLRHTAGSMLARLGVAPRDAQAILGHASITTTLSVYTHASSEDVRAAMARYGIALSSTPGTETDIDSEE